MCASRAIRWAPYFWCGVLVFFFLLSANAQAALSLQKAAPAGGAADVSALLRQAQEALGRNDFAKVAEALKQVVQAQPAMTRAWFNLGYAYTELHQDQEAVAAYRKAVELEPDLFEARLNLGILLIKMKDPRGAREQLEKAAALKPDHTLARLYYGRSLAQTGQTAFAEQQYQAVLRLEPKLAIARYDLGQLYLEQKRYTEALASFQEAYGLDASLAQAQLGIALAEEGLNAKAEAAAHFDKYLAARPDDVETRFHLARLYLDEKRGGPGRTGGSLQG